MDKYIKLEDLNNFFDRMIKTFEPCPDKYDAAVFIQSAAASIPTTEQDQLVMLPVRPGEYLYRKYDSGIQVLVVYNVQVRATNFWINVIQKEPPTLYPFRDYLDGREIGKVFFRSKEEAERYG